MAVRLDSAGIVNQIAYRGLFMMTTLRWSDVHSIKQKMAWPFMWYPLEVIQHHFCLLVEASTGLPHFKGEYVSPTSWWEKYQRFCIHFHYQNLPSIWIEIQDLILSHVLDQMTLFEFSYLGTILFFFLNKNLLEHNSSYSYSLTYCCSCFHTTTANLSSCYRDHMSLKTPNICCLVFFFFAE